jgi:hypothetical protein
MLRIVLPASLAAVSAANIRAVAPLDIRVAVEIVVGVDGNVVVSPPAGAIPPPSRPHCAHRYSNAKGKCHSCDVIARWIGIGRRGCAVHHRGITRRHIHDLRVGLFDDNYLLAFHSLGFHFDLFVGFQGSLLLGLLAHALDCGHYIALLGKEGVPQVRSPRDVVYEIFDYIGQSGHGLDTRVPVFFLYGIGEGFVFQIFVFREPLLELNQFQGIGGCCENLRQKRVRVKRDGGN